MFPHVPPTRPLSMRFFPASRTMVLASSTLMHAIPRQTSLLNCVLRESRDSFLNSAHFFGAASILPLKWSIKKRTTIPPTNPPTPAMREKKSNTASETSGAII